MPRSFETLSDMATAAGVASSKTVVDQSALQTSIDDAAQTSVQDIADIFGAELGGTSILERLTKDVNGRFGSTGEVGQEIEGLGDIADSINGIPMPARVSSIDDLMGMTDPNRIDTGGNNGDPLRQSHGSRDMPGNINVNGGGGDGYTVEKGGITLQAGESARIQRWGAEKPEHYKNGEHIATDEYTMSVDTTLRYDNGSYQKTHSERDTSGNVTHTATIYDSDGKVVETKTTEVLHKFKPLPVSRDPDGCGGDGGIDGGNTPLIDGDNGAGGTQGDLGEVYLNLGIGSSGGDGQVNSSLDDFLDAIGGVAPTGLNADEGGQGEGVDGNTESAPITPPYYIEHHANLIGAEINPIPYVF